MNTITSLDQLKNEPNPLTKLVAELAALDAIQYDQKRKEVASTHNIRVGTLDQLVDAAKKALEGGAEGETQFKEWLTEPWGTEINGAELLNEIFFTFKKYVIADHEALWAATAWTCLTWLSDHATVLPMAMISAPEKGCGKTILLSVLEKMACRPLQAGCITPAAIYRSVEHWQPTLLLDEADSFMRENEELRGILNSGHTRNSAFKILTEEIRGERVPVRFSTWGAKAIAGIKLETLNATLTSRSIIIPMRRKKPNEITENFRHADQSQFEIIRSKIFRWTLDNGEEFSAMRPELPELSNRDADNWEPLLSIAELAGGEWPAKLRLAALKIVGKAEETPSLDAELLQDIKMAFDACKADRLPTVKLKAELEKDELAPWATYNRGQPMTPRQLAHKLAAYNIQPKAIRVGQIVFKGYLLSDFSDVFARYLQGGKLSVTQSQFSIEAGCGEFSSVTPETLLPLKNTLSGASDAECYHVTDKTGGVPEPGKVEVLF